MSSGGLPGLEEFLKDYPKMRIAPLKNSSFMLSGEFEFSVPRTNLPHVADSYALKIEVPNSFPQVAPLVTETGNKIPRDDKHHVNSDHTLCLGSPLRLLWKSKRAPTLVGFAEECLVPYLYSISHKLQYGTFPFGELEHGKPGVISDYMDLFGLKSREQVLRALELLGMKKRLANKKPCPCGCGRRLGACKYHAKMVELRKLASSSWFRQHLATLGSGK
jgi:hypothetical protein